MTITPEPNDTSDSTSDADTPVDADESAAKTAGNAAEAADTQADNSTSEAADTAADNAEAANPTGRRRRRLIGSEALLVGTGIAVIVAAIVLTVFLTVNSDGDADHDNDDVVVADKAAWREEEWADACPELGHDKAPSEDAWADKDGWGDKDRWDKKGWADSHKHKRGKGKHGLHNRGCAPRGAPDRFGVPGKGCTRKGLPTKPWAGPGWEGPRWADPDWEGFGGEFDPGARAWGWSWSDGDRQRFTPEGGMAQFDFPMPGWLRRMVPWLFIPEGGMSQFDGDDLPFGLPFDLDELPSDLDPEFGPGGEVPEDLLVPENLLEQFGGLIESEGLRDNISELITGLIEELFQELSDE